MATPAQWLAGARPRTLPAAVAPVLAGTGVAAYADEWVWWKALLALVVSLALQVAVNYANDYSDGIRGTDDVRVGPMRLVGSGAAAPAAVKRAAFAAFGVAGVAGLVLAATTAWWLVAVGLACVVAAWFYTGGSKPYGYLGLGEVMVFVFFGLVAVIGTTYVQTEAWEWAGAVRRRRHRRARLRDPGGQQPARHPDRHGRRQADPRRTARRPAHPLALRVLVVVAAAPSWSVAAATTLVGARRARLRRRGQPAVRTVVGGATGPGLIPVLQQTGLAELRGRCSWPRRCCLA